MCKQRVQFDNGPLPGGTDFVNPIGLIKAETPAEVPQAFTDLQNAQSNGYWLAGYASYELGYVLCPKLENLLPPQRALPLLHFGIFEHPQRPAGAAEKDAATIETPQPLWDLERYSEAFRTIHNYISAGDIYQANLTFPLISRFSGPVAALYQRLCEKQPVPHGALVDLGGTALLSRSPELFFSLSADGQLTTKPMKGTAPRGATQAEDDALMHALQTSEKNRAENLMIVDLLRNDMSRVSQNGSVQVPELFSIERYATLHQMTSRITSRVCEGTTIKDLFAALFPCGSIAGAPKIRAMQILRELEEEPREAYCGSIGWLAPDGSMEFNVAIRTLMCRDNGTVQLNVGGGVVFDSVAEDEYAEALLKSQFAMFD
jgi:para-aminobenzoate synthetase component 1